MYSFTFERLSVVDLWAIAAWKVRGFTEADALDLFDMIRRTYDGDVAELSIVESNALMQAFGTQLAAFLTDLNAPASPDLAVFRRLFNDAA